MTDHAGTAKVFHSLIMKDPRAYKQLHALLIGKNRFLIAVHQKPDADTLGAGTALAHWLIKQNKEVTLFCKDIPGRQHAYLDHYFDIQSKPEVFDRAYDAVIILDSSTSQYCGVDELLTRLPPGYLIINIDHHNTNNNFGDFNLVDKNAGSTSEIIGVFFELNQIDPDPAIATSIMAGILSDTSYFTNAATNATGLDLTGKLIASGARTTEISQSLLKNKNAETLRLWGTALSRLKINRRLNMAITYLKTEDLQQAGAEAGATEGISNFLGGTCGETDIIMLLTQADENHIKGSIRSTKKDISKIAQALGGGGHKLASGFKIQGRFLETEKDLKII